MKSTAGQISAESSGGSPAGARRGRRRQARGRHGIRRNVAAPNLIDRLTLGQPRERRNRRAARPPATQRSRDAHRLDGHRDVASLKRSSLISSRCTGSARRPRTRPEPEPLHRVADAHSHGTALRRPTSAAPPGTDHMSSRRGQVTQVALLACHRFSTPPTADRMGPVARGVQQPHPRRQMPSQSETGLSFRRVQQPSGAPGAC